MYISRLARVARGLKLLRLPGSEASLWGVLEKCRAALGGPPRACPEPVEGGCPYLGPVFATGSALLALHSRGFELVAFLPADELGKAGRFPAQSEAEARHGGVADEIHLGMVFIAWLVIVLLDVFFILREAPGFVVPFELCAFVDGKGWNADARQTEVIGAGEVS